MTCWSEAQPLVIKRKSRPNIVKLVRAAKEPLKVPLLIPEYRYEGRLPKHKYRLDFTIINPDTMDKVGFELSPWSTMVC